MFVFHFGQWSTAYGNPEGVAGLQILALGQTGVDLFFVISGFLITGILLRQRDCARPLSHFYVRRCLRIFPLYYAYLLLFFGIGAVWQIHDFSWREMWWYLPFLQNVAATFCPSHLGGPQHFWSLAVEEHFYLLWPWMVVFFPVHRLRFLCAALVVVAFLVRCAFLLVGLDVFTFTLCRMDALAMGAWLALVQRDPPAWNRLGQAVRLGWLPGFCILALLYTLLSGAQTLLLQAAKYTLTATAYAVLLVMVLNPKSGALAPRLFSAPWLRSLGRISYGFYVFHPYLMQRLTGLFFREAWSPWHGQMGPAMVADFLLLFGLTLAISLTSWKYLEMPFLRLKKNFS